MRNTKHTVTRVYIDEDGRIGFTPLEEPRMIHIWNEGDIPEELLPEPLIDSESWGWF